MSRIYCRSNQTLAHHAIVAFSKRHGAGLADVTVTHESDVFLDAKLARFYRL